MLNQQKSISKLFWKVSSYEFNVNTIQTYADLLHATVLTFECQIFGLNESYEFNLVGKKRPMQTKQSI